MNLNLVPHRWQKEKVNRHKLKFFFTGHIYEVKILSINKFYLGEGRGKVKGETSYLLKLLAEI